MEINDCWSLLAVVKECAAITKLQAQANLIETNLTTSITTTNVGPLETDYSAVNFTLPSAAATAAAQGSIPKDKPRNFHKVARAQFSTETNLPTSVTITNDGPLETNYLAVNFTLPLAATPAAQGSVPEDEPRDLHKSPLLPPPPHRHPLPHVISTVKTPLTEVGAKHSMSENDPRDLHKPLLLPPPHHHSRLPHVISTAKTPVTAATNPLVHHNPQHQPLLRSFSINGSLDSFAPGVDHHCFFKRKKVEDKRVVSCTLEELSRNDNWAWRKYGQKPIKGSPYPRNYYRCSSMKGCNARRQVERSPIDPYAYIVTYTSNHLHPPPPTRIFNRPRIKYSGSDMSPPPNLESPVETVASQIESGYGSRSGTTVQNQISPEYESGSGSGSNEDKFNEDEKHDCCGILGSGVMDKGKDKDHGILIPNLTADSDHLTGKEQLDGGKKISNVCSCSSRISRSYLQ